MFRQTEGQNFPLENSVGVLDHGGPEESYLQWEYNILRVKIDIIIKLKRGSEIR